MLLKALLPLLEGEGSARILFPKEKFAVLIHKGRLTKVQGDPPERILEEELKTVVPEKVLLRAKKTAEVSGSPLSKVLQDLGIEPEGIAKVHLQVASRLLEEKLLSSENDTVTIERVAGTVEGDGEPIPLYHPIVQALSRTDPKELLTELPRWGEREFHPREPLFSQLPEDLRNFLKEGEKETSLKEYLKKSPIPPRQALAYLILTTQLRWFPPRSPSPTPPPPQPQDEPSLPPTLSPSPPPPPKPTPPPPPPSPPFYLKPVPPDPYARLGIPPETTGQGVTQAYSRRLMEVRKALEEKPGDRNLQAWQEGLLRAYRILTHPQAFELYQTFQTQGVPEGERDRKVFEAMGNLAFERGISELRAGERYQGVKLIQEALSWNPRLARALAILALHQAWGEEYEGVKEAIRVLEKALEISPDDPYLYYLYGILCYTAGDAEEGFQRAQTFFAKNPGKAPPSWKEFLRSEVTG